MPSWSWQLAADAQERSVVADPLLLSALFVGLTHGMSTSQRAEVAWRGRLLAYGILVAVGLGGASLLRLLVVAESGG